MDKTNVMRILDNAHINYNVYTYDENETSGENVAKLVGIEPERVFKTLVTIANTKEYFVFMIPVSSELNLKKAACVANVKSIEMIKQKELLALTGYIHGGCSPIGMKKKFPTFIDEMALLFPAICFSAGKRGHQVEVATNDLIEFACAKTTDLTI